jgi:hypothetical protein
MFNLWKTFKFGKCINLKNVQIQKKFKLKNVDILEKKSPKFKRRLNSKNVQVFKIILNNQHLNIFWI